MYKLLDQLPGVITLDPALAPSASHGAIHSSPRMRASTTGNARSVSSLPGSNDTMPTPAASSADSEARPARCRTPSTPLRPTYAYGSGVVDPPDTMPSIAVSIAKYR